MTHLWEGRHPYYATEGNYFSGGMHVSFDSWEEFYEIEGNSDPDMNLVYRWDWQSEYGDDGEDVLSVFFVGQRKASLRSVSVIVVKSDESEVRAWLVKRAKTMAAIWNPIGLDLDESFLDNTDQE